MPLPECPRCSLPLVPGPDGDRCPTCGPVRASRRDRYDDYEPRRDRHDDYEPRRGGGDRYDRRERDDDDYPRRHDVRGGVPWYVVLMGSFMVGVAALSLLGHGAIFCYGSYEEFVRNNRPDPGGLIALAVLAAILFCCVVALAAGFFMILGRQYWLGFVGCVAVALCTHLLILGLPVAIISLVVLLQEEVKEAYR